MAQPMSRSPRRAASSIASGSRPSAARIVRLFSGPPSEYWPIDPSVRTTRWQGTMSGTGLWPSAVPTARTALGRPISAATQPYGRTSPRGISSALRQTSCSKSRVAAQVEVDAHPAVAGQPSLDLVGEDRRQGVGRGRPGGRSSRGGGSAKASRSSVALSTRATPRPFQATNSGPMGESMAA